MAYLGRQPNTGVRSRYIYTATASQTTFSGSDDDGKTLKYEDAAYLDVFLNGVLLKPVTDYTATSKTSVVLTSGAAVSDIVEIVAYDIANIANTVSATNGGTFEADVTVQGTVTADGLTVDTDTLYVDAANNRVGAGTASPARTLHVNNDGESFIRITSSDTGNAGLEFGDQSDGVQGAIFQNSTDNSLRFNGYNNSERMRIDSSGNVDIGSTGGGAKLAVAGAVGTQNGSAAAPAHTFYGDNDTGMFRVAADTLGFSTSGTERMRIDSSGNLLVHKTSPDQAVEGMEFASGNYLLCTKSGGTTAYFNRTTSDGAIAELRKNGSTVGIIGTYGSTTFIQSGASASHAGLLFNTSMVEPARANGTSGSDPRRDNVLDLGSPSYRFDDVYATNGTIQTSDANEKQQIAVLTDAEIAAAKRISAGFKTFKWNDAVEAKGDNARTHTGVIAQEVQTALEAEGLDAGNYAFWMSDTWWETQTEVPAVEADEENGIEAVEAYTRTDTYATLEEAPEGATERTRLGIRYPELLAFIGAATEQRLTSIEARLATLENA